MLNYVVNDQDGGHHEVIVDPYQQAKIQERLDRARELNSVRMIKGERLLESDVRYHCLCCTPSTTPIPSADPSGGTQYTCPVSKITMRYARMRPLPYTDPTTGRTEYRDASTYMAGHLILPG